jgi:hypothetical protein
MDGATPRRLSCRKASPGLQQVRSLPATGRRTTPSTAGSTPVGPPQVPDDLEEGHDRGRGLPELHHPGHREGRLGQAHPGSSGVQLHRWSGDRPRKARQSGQAEAGGLRAPLPGEPAPRGVEAKDNTHAPGAGLQQALAYAEALDMPFVFSSNGDAFMMHDRVGPGPKEVDVALDAFPSPAELWNRYRAWKGLDATAEKVVRFPFHDDRLRQGAPLLPAHRGSADHRGGRPRAAARAARHGHRHGQDLHGFQIIWRLWKAGTVGRVLFLADRNVLASSRPRTTISSPSARP